MFRYNLGTYETGVAHKPRGQHRLYGQQSKASAETTTALAMAILERHMGLGVC